MAEATKKTTNEVKKKNEEKEGEQKDADADVDVDGVGGFRATRRPSIMHWRAPSISSKI